jgi:hypothetical protein
MDDGKISRFSLEDMRLPPKILVPVLFCRLEPTPSPRSGKKNLFSTSSRK